MKQPQPTMVEAPAKTIVGMRLQVSLQDIKTQELWQSFGPRRKEVQARVDMGNYSLQVYPKGYFTRAFSPAATFDKWAGVAVVDTDTIPEGMEVLVIDAGTWAVFTYKGVAREFHKFAGYIYGVWLPQSGYQLREAPHYEYMPAGYAGPNDPEAEEEVWIPVQKA